MHMSACVRSQPHRMVCVCVAQAKTVVFTSVRKFDGQDFRLVTSGEYIQMSGRAGRRGLDERGLVITMLEEKIETSVAKAMLKVRAPTALCSGLALQHSTASHHDICIAQHSTALIFLSDMQHFTQLMHMCGACIGSIRPIGVCVSFGLQHAIEFAARGRRRS
jgi:hypothetical protein